MIIARMVLRKRRKSKFSQRQLAAKVGCSQPYLAQVETGVRPISKKIAEKLEGVFKVKPGTYTKAVFPRGRPPRGAEARQALRQISRAKGKAPRALVSVGPPRFPRADRVFGLEVTAVVQLDGAPYHGNRDAEKRRDRDLGVDVLHVDACEVGKPGLLKKIFDWLGGLLD